MRAFLAALPLLFLTGCYMGDPIAITAYSVAVPTGGGVSLSQAESKAERIVAAQAQDHGLVPFERKGRMSSQAAWRTYSDWVPGTNPTLFLTLHLRPLPLRVEMREQYAVRPSAKHRQLRHDLREQLERAGLRVEDSRP